MFDKHFDPYALLEQLADQQRILNNNQEILSNGLTEQKTAIEQLITANNHHVTELERLIKLTDDVHHRLRLLEVVRQYENQQDNNQTLN